THEVVGSRYYRAPEVLHGARGDARSDVYSLARPLEGLLVGLKPDELSPRSLPRGGDLSDRACREIDAVIAKAASVEPGHRHASVEEFLRALPELHIDLALDDSEDDALLDDDRVVNGVDAA